MKDYTPVTALQETIKIWKYMAENDCSKHLAVYELKSKFNTHNCPLCEYVLVKEKRKEQHVNISCDTDMYTAKCHELCPVQTNYKWSNGLKPVPCTHDLSPYHDWQNSPVNDTERIRDNRIRVITYLEQSLTMQLEKDNKQDNTIKEGSP